MKRRDFINDVQGSPIKGLDVFPVLVPQPPIPVKAKKGVDVTFGGYLLGTVTFENIKLLEWQVSNDVDFKTWDVVNLISVRPRHKYKYLRFFVKGVGPSENSIDLSEAESR